MAASPLYANGAMTGLIALVMVVATAVAACSPQEPQRRAAQFAVDLSITVDGRSAGIRRILVEPNRMTSLPFDQVDPPLLATLMVSQEGAPDRVKLEGAIQKDTDVLLRFTDHLMRLGERSDIEITTMGRPQHKYRFSMEIEPVAAL